jgi:NADPH-dependent F420 reductase
VTESAFNPLPIVAVIGIGAVGGGLGVRFAKAGYKVIYGVRDPSAERVAALLAKSGPASLAATPAEAAAQAALILVAVPWLQILPMLATIGDLDGKVLMDATNPISRAPGGGAIFDLHTSVAEYLQRWAPKSKVVKAFNASNRLTLADPGLVDGPITIPLAGEDAEAKAMVAALARAAGFDAMDVGGLRNARHLEAMAQLYVDMNAQDRPDGFEFYLRPRPSVNVLGAPPKTSS